MLLEGGVWLRCVYGDGEVKVFDEGLPKIDAYEMEIQDEKGVTLSSSGPPRSWYYFDRLGKLLEGNAQPEDFDKLFVATPR